MNDAHKPDDLHDEELSRLYRQSRVEEPPMALDSAILSRARKAVETPKRRWRLSAWLMPVTATAIALLTATLFIQMRHEHPEAVAPASVEEAAPALKSTHSNEERMREELGQPKMKDEMKRQSVAPTPSVAPVPPAATARLAKPSATGVAEPEAQPERRPTLQEKSIQADQFAPPAEQSAGDKAATNGAARTGKILYPESWIAKIRQLLKQGNKDAALKEAKAFRAAYPDQPLPDDITAALK